MTEVSQTESQVLAGVARGERGAMEECIASYGALVWSIVRRFVSDHATAEDLTQESFTAIWKSAHRFDARIASEKTFIATISRRQALNHLRKMKSRPVLSPMPDPGTLGAGEAQELPENDEVRWDGERAKQALAALPEETQNIFRLHFEQGLTHPELAQHTGLPLGTIKTRLRRGLITLRDRMMGADPPPAGLRASSPSAP